MKGEARGLHKKPPTILHSVQKILECALMRDGRETTQPVGSCLDTEHIPETPETSQRGCSWCRVYLPMKPDSIRSISHQAIRFSGLQKLPAKLNHDLRRRSLVPQVYNAAVKRCQHCLMVSEACVYYIYIKCPEETLKLWETLQNLVQWPYFRRDQ